MSGPKPDEKTEEGAEVDSLEALEARGDVDTLLAEAKAARAARDMLRALAFYEAAARLGNGEANYATALFHLTGQTGSIDLKKGSAHLRAAAEAGILPAKVYMGNLYELGIHFQADPEKADVWYRSAARQAAIEEEWGTLDHQKRMAELGCVRFFLALENDASIKKEEKSAWEKKARTLGYQLKQRTSMVPSEPLPMPDRMSLKPEEPKPEAKKPEPKKEAKKEPPKEEKKPSRFWTPWAGTKAFFVELLFLAAALASGHLIAEGSKMVTLPIIGAHPERAYMIALALLGVLPAFLVYRGRTVIAALGAAAATAGIGFYLHGSPKGTFLDPRIVQILAFGLAGWLGALLVLGIFGGAKRPKKAGKPILTRPSPSD